MRINPDEVVILTDRINPDEVIIPPEATADRQGTTRATGWQQPPGKDPGLLTEFLGGAKHAWDRAAYGIADLLAPNQTGNDSPLFPSAAQRKRELQEGAQFVKQTGPMSSIGQFAGDVAMSAPVALKLFKAVNAARMGVPALAGKLGVLAPIGAETALNAGYGALTADEGKAGEGAAWGAGGTLVGQGFGRVAKALTPTAEAEALLAKGVPLTYGQRLGPPIQSVERALAKVPYVGAPIRARQAEALQGWQQATRDAASPGARTIDEVGGNLGARYKELLPTEPFAHVPKIDPTPLGYTILEKVPGITSEMLTNIEREVIEAVAHADSPALFHQGVSTLKGIAHQYKTSADPTHRLYGNGLSAAADKVSESWRAGLSKEVQGELANVDKAWSQFVPIRSASTKYVQTLDNPENYTPRMLQQTLRMRDPTLGKTSFRETPQGQLAHQGEQTVGSASNNPTAGSGILSLLLGGGATAFGHTPAAASTAALGYLYGTKPAQQALIGTLPGQRMTAEALRRWVPAATVSLTRSPQDD